ncbi:glycosyltransferase [Tahibacter amnicola]|uniref:Glycosyltransferase n=2 Tax=Tahibacter amnicola TaxID=2976241 RepID=A0ABY6BNR9_9GAMM|nr:glycosyltransferase [Tahibacter amnicola]UXI70700.1 glycosyltransferase [Tahibacter amnicola]
MDDPVSGPSLSVRRLCESMADESVATSLLCLAVDEPLRNVTLSLMTQWRALGTFGFTPRWWPALGRAYAECDIVHNHSLWAFPNMVCGWRRPRLGRAALVVSPRGTLAPAALARSRFKKLLAGPLQRPTLARADLLHATSPMEYEDIRRAGWRRPVAVVPNGIDIPALSVAKEDAAMRRLLFLGRIHPIKRLDRLLESWRQLQFAHPDWELVIAGKGAPAYIEGLKRQAFRCGLLRCHFSGPVIGPAKNRMLAGSDLLVLPSASENFGMVVAESLASGVPVVTTHGAPWSGLAERGCGWWVSADGITTALDEAMRCSPGTLRQMGSAGRAWMAEDFSWPIVAARLVESYRWIRDGGTAPEWVALA